MRFVIQRVSEAKVEVDGRVTGAIGLGFVVLIGVSATDDKGVADKMIRKLAGMRIFRDEEGKTNLDLNSVDGELLLISQFTLYADCKHGNRPSFTEAGPPELANEIYEYIIDELKKIFGEERVATGVFGGDMKLSLVNQGPFTVILDSADL